MKKTLDSFTHRYSLSKTLRFRLIPRFCGDGDAQEKFLKTLLSEDEVRSKHYPKMKEMLDGMHKKHIADSLGGVKLGEKWEELAAAIRTFRTKKEDSAKKALAEKQEELRKAIATAAKWEEKNPEHKKLIAATPKDLLTELEAKAHPKTDSSPAGNGPAAEGKTEAEKAANKRVEETLSEEEKEALRAFKGFACYFIGFQKNRANIYATEAQATAIPNRLVNENFPKFLDNLEAYQTLAQQAPQILEDAEKELKDLLGDRKLGDFFTTTFYDECLTQAGIDAYNLLIGGRSQEAGEKKIRGLNEFVNLHCQTHPEDQHLRKKARFSLLYKLILSDRVSASFIPDAFDSDEEVRDAVRAYQDSLDSCILDGKKTHAIEKLAELFQGLSKGEFDSAHVFVGTGKLAALSQAAFQDWSLIERMRDAYAQAHFTNKRQREAFAKQEEYSLAEIKAIIDFARDQQWENLKGKEFETVFQGIFGKEGCRDKVRATAEKTKRVLSETRSLRENDEDADALKEYLDAVLDCLHLCEIFAADADMERDAGFYDLFDHFTAALHPVVPLYNAVRNYMSQRPADVAKKFKLMFQNPTLAAGWDQNKEKNNTAILLLRDGKYYLGVMNAKDKPAITPEEDAGPHPYQKMVYKLLPGPNKMLPKVFFSQKWRDQHDIPSRILHIREKRSYKKGATYSERDSIDFIDYYKSCIAEYSDWSVFQFKFSPTETYGDINDFFNEITQQGFKITFDAVSEEQIHHLVQEKKLMLFQIYSKDFAEKSHGNPNLHTLYWKSLFDEENLRDLVMKLNGDAELFYRPAVAMQPTIHKEGSVLVNRRTKDGEVIPEEIYRRLYRNANGELRDEQLEEGDLDWKKRIRSHKAKHAITKDRRYTEGQYQFHVPIKLNAGCLAKFNAKEFNQEVRKTASETRDIHIIGLDRGERNLVYLSLIDRHGNICLQRSFNVLNGMDYQTRLKDREKERQTARKSWKGVGTIKELKEGYLSQVVHEIAKLMVEHKAIVVMEDLNFGFKRGRFGVERQVYQKFEKALIDKLNYMAFKDRGPREAGGILNAFQFATPIQSFETLGKQSGFLFYVPAAYTSKIDPTTGFTNLLDLRYTNAEKAKDLLGRFTGIRYHAEEKHFEFVLDYSRFETRFPDFRKEWTVCTHGDVRYSYNPTTKQTEAVNVTERLKELFTKQGIAWEGGADLKGAIEKSSSAEFLKGLLWLLKLTMGMRYSKDDEDFILSPVRGANGRFFDSRESLEGLPKDADANGAYHIALKALCLMQRKDFEESGDLKLSNEDWLEFAQKRRE